MGRAQHVAGLLAFAAFAGLACGAQARAQSPAHAKPRTISFSGYAWTVRADGKGGPGPNHWSADNVSVDANGALHLKLTQSGGVWYCAELETVERLGFGTYQFWLDTRVDNFDPNIVLGLFDYTVPKVGPDATNEIDIEFSRWGNPKWPNGNYTVYPATLLGGGKPSGHTTFEVSSHTAQSTQRFARTAAGVTFQSLSGHQNHDARLYQAWTFAPKDPKRLVPQSPIPVHVNLWLAKGKAPTDGKPVEVVIRAFSFTPQPAG